MWRIAGTSFVVWEIHSFLSELPDSSAFLLLFGSFSLSILFLWIFFSDVLSSYLILTYLILMHSFIVSSISNTSETFIESLFYLSASVKNFLISSLIWGNPPLWPAQLYDLKESSWIILWVPAARWNVFASLFRLPVCYRIFAVMLLICTGIRSYTNTYKNRSAAALPL